ncbi:MAG TPA: arabinan endo-1,5-alpha-L-arabinosidase [Devosia sp.]|nr:arabinan endo-1,5-alpha-L-arabinosidase [Devosia sp.]
MLFAAPALAASPTQPVLSGDLGIHDPTMIVVDGTYVAYYTGQEGGIYRGAIRAKTSTDGVAWKDAGAIGKGLPAWVQPTLGVKPPNLWAPTVSRHGSSYFLYYAASIFGMNLSAIGLMTTSHLDPAHPGDGWTDQGLVLKSGISDKFNAIDPFRIDTADGRAWLSYGSYWDGIKLVELDPETGKTKADAKPVGLASRSGGAIEASALLAHDGKYYLFVSYDRCCAGSSSTYRIMVGRADTVTGPYLDRQGRPMLKGYATQLQRTTGRFIGPGGQEPFAGPHGEEMLVYHYYDGDDLGKSKLEIAPIRWSADGWPSLDPLPIVPAGQATAATGR